MEIMSQAKFHFNRLMLTLMFGVRSSEPPGPGERPKRPGLIGLIVFSSKIKYVKAFVDIQGKFLSIFPLLERRMSANFLRFGLLV